MGNKIPTNRLSARQQPKGPTENTGSPSSGQPPVVSLPKGGGAIQGMGEKFQVNPVTGTGSLSVPIALSPGRSGFTPQLMLRYDSGVGNSPFGMGWNIDLPTISRKTQKGLPRYQDQEESDTFLLSGAEDLVPVLHDPLPKEDRDAYYTIKRYRPRIEGLFARIEKWTGKNGEVFWRSITKENITTIYGQSDDAKIYFPEDSDRPDKRVFQWLIERTFDDKGNIIYYEYKPENAINLPEWTCEKNRQSSAQRYLKRVWYGNTASYLHLTDQGLHKEPEWEAWTQKNAWLFELVFDYGEHQVQDGAPTWDDAHAAWPSRPDPFSNFRAGFDIRTYRLCQKILMFHRFRELGEEPYLVRSTDLRYQKNPVATKLVGVAHTSYRKRINEVGYESASMPELTFYYNEVQPDHEVQEVASDLLANLPQGIDAQRYRFTDLYGEGISGVLTQSDQAWYYKPNLGEGRFGPMERIAEIPAVANLYDPEQQLLDLAGNGQQHLVIQSPGLHGYYEIDDEGHWKNFRAFEHNPNLNWSNPNLRLIDLTGDGHADILISENDCFVWSQSLAEKGFEAAQRVHKALDEADGPRVVFHDRTQSIHLTDMSGDGLIDIVRIRNGAICYWPNLGYGRFGARIQMEGAPRFAHADHFNPYNLRLADIDGSGTTDIFYLGNGTVRYWYNESGNNWSEAYSMPNFPHVDSLSTVQVLDLLGRGTAQLVWSSPLPGERYAPLRYIDLMPRKPHLLVGVNNHMGSVTKLEYKASTYFYLKDKEAGTPWITSIPFPVHVLVRQDIHDEISGNHFVSRYAYHHGYFDGEEREFRGFGMVEQWDTEDFMGMGPDQSYTPPGSNWSEKTDVPPIHTKTWFHTGFYERQHEISSAYAAEYYQGDPDAWLPADTILPPGLTADETPEACRALKGSMLRQEVYADDHTAKAAEPYTVTEANYCLQCLQEKGPNPHAVFLVTPRENLVYHYERKSEDPRIAHTLNLITDHYGNSTHALSIVYPRRGNGHSPEQKKLYAILSENLLLHPDTHPDWYRHSLPSSTRTYEVHGLARHYKGAKFEMEGEKGLQELLAPFFRQQDQAPEINLRSVLDHSATPSDKGPVQLRLLSETRVKYRKNDLTSPVPFGKSEALESLCLPYESYTLAFTRPILEQPVLEGRISTDLLMEGGYLKSTPLLFEEEEDKWWIPSGQALFFYPEAATDAALAASRFYLPVGERTPLGQESYLFYDHSTQTEASYFLFVEKAVGPLGNTLQLLDYDYRVLQAKAMLDINDNRSDVAFDIRGMVIAAALMGKDDEGDELVFRELHCDAEATALPAILTKPEDHIQRATTWFHYDVFAWQRDRQPPFAVGLSREVHYHQPGGADSPVQIAVTYSDGFGREILTKVQAEDGEAPTYENGKLRLDEQNRPILSFTKDRWVGNGRTIFNNKGKPVQQYEPFFDSHAHFTEEVALIYLGVTPTIHYDPLTRVIRTDMQDGTFSKVAFTPWEQWTYDQNDTVLEPDCRWYRQRVATTGNDGEHDPAEVLAARKAAMHNNTPTLQYLDTLGRPFVSIAHNRYLENYKNENSLVEHYIPTHTFLDIEGKPLEIWDGRRSNSLDSAGAAIDYNLRGQSPGEHAGNRVMTYAYAMGGLQLYQNSMDAGRRWALTNVMGNPIYAWDEQERVIHKSYDALQRPTHLEVSGPDQPLLPAERLFYGEDATDHSANLRGQLVLHFDGAGLAWNEAFDFKGNPSASSRLLAGDYQTVPNWKDLAEMDLPLLLEALARLKKEQHSLLDQVLEPHVYTTSARFDALNRPIRSVSPDQSVSYPLYNKANLLDMVRLNLHGRAKVPDESPEGIRSNADLQSIVKNIDYNAKGQRERIAYGNGVTTRYAYDDTTFRLKRLYSTRNQGTEVLQDIQYYYDPVGNITELYDQAQRTIFIDKQKVEPHHGYTYDALYQLICATGRESRRIAANHPGHEEIPLLGNIPIADNEVRNYRQYYRYDPAGNIEEMRHVAKGGNWTRNYAYETRNNRLLKAYKGAENPADPAFAYDAHGSMTTMPHLHRLDWDYKDQLIHVQKTANGEGEVFFTYDSGRQRVRKAFVQNGTVKERIYLGSYEIYRINGTVILETLHVADNEQRIAMIETPSGEVPRYRYQLSNHLGSASLELNDTAEVITYEEYHPYGTTSFRARTSGVEVSAKRYRYTGMERDGETGLGYHTARYYLAWLGRWGSCDPSGLIDGLNIYQYSLNNPVVFVDLSGLQAGSLDEAKEGIKWEKEILGKLKEKIPIVEQVTVRAKIKGVLVTSVLDGLGLSSDGLIFIEAKLSENTQLRHAQLLIKAHLESGGTVTISASKNSKIEELRRLGLSPEVPIGGKNYHVIRRGNAPDILRKLQAIPEDMRTFFNYETGHITFHSKKEINRAYELAREWNTTMARTIEEVQIELPKSIQQKMTRKTISKGGQKVTKYASSSVPLLGALLTLFGSGEASAAERILRAIGGEIGVGLLDLESIYDLADHLAKRSVKEAVGGEKRSFKYEGEWHYAIENNYKDYFGVYNSTGKRIDLVLHFYLKRKYGYDWKKTNRWAH